MPSYFKLFPINGPQSGSHAGALDHGPQAPPPARNIVPSRVAQVLPVLVCLFLGATLNAQTAPAQTTASPQATTPVLPPASKPSISLSPAVIMAKGNFGQGLTQTLTLSNQTGRDFAF